MGQYYTIINLTKREFLEPYGGVKLMEWSYCYNNTTTHLMNLLAGDWFGDKVVVAGDYTDREDFERYKPDASVHPEYGVQNIYSYADAKFKNVSKSKNKYDDWNDSSTRMKLKKKYQIVFNATRKELVVMGRLPYVLEYYEKLDDGRIRYVGNEPKHRELYRDYPNLYVEHKRTIFAPSLLLATSNGRGGGDYGGVDGELCGSWVTDHQVGDEIGVCHDIEEFMSKISDWEVYKEIYPKFIEH